MFCKLKCFAYFSKWLWLVGLNVLENVKDSCIFTDQTGPIFYFWFLEHIYNQIHQIQNNVSRIWRCKSEDTDVGSRCQDLCSGIWGGFVRRSNRYLCSDPIDICPEIKLVFVLGSNWKQYNNNPPLPGNLTSTMSDRKKEKGMMRRCHQDLSAD